MQNRIKLIIAIVLIALSNMAFASQELTTKKANQLKDIASPLKGVDPTIPDDTDLNVLDKVIGDARVG